MRRNFLILLVAMAVAAGLAIAQSAAPAGQGTWSEHPPGVGHDKQRKDEKGTASADRDSIQKLVEQQLQSDPALSSVTAEVDNNDIVTLTGNVATKNDRDHAKQLAESVPGVKKVKDKLKIGVSSSGPPSEHYAASAQSDKGNTAGSIAGNSQSQPGSNPMATSKENEIQNAIQNQVVDSRVSVKETDHTIVLSGVVPSNDAKTQAEQIAQQYTSGKQVVNELTVGSVSAASPSGGDSAMRRRIETALRNEATLSPTVVQSIAVNTINNKVVLSGTVPTQADKDKLQQVAEQNASGMQVVNNVQVSSPSSSTASPETAGGVAGSAGSVASSNSSQTTGAVSGNVGEQSQSSSGSAGQSTASEQAPTGAATAAQNNLDLKTQIENSLQKEQLTGVIVNVTDTTIDLSGTVRNSKEKQTARRIAQSFAGNRKLADHIKVGTEAPTQNTGSESQNQPMNENPPGVRSPGNPSDPTNPSPNPVPPHQ